MTTINHEPDSYCLPLAQSIIHEPDKCCLRLLRLTYHGSHPCCVVLIITSPFKQSTIAMWFGGIFYILTWLCPLFFPKSFFQKTCFQGTFFVYAFKDKLAFTPCSTQKQQKKQICTCINSKLLGDKFRFVAPAKVYGSRLKISGNITESSRFIGIPESLQVVRGM